MVPQKSGSILNMSSVSAFNGNPKITSYGPAKAAIANLTQNLAMEWAPYNIRVNALAPGLIVTPMLEKAHRDRGDSLEVSNKRVPLGRLGTPDEVAKAALFMISDDAAYITGHILVIDGGWATLGH